MPFDRIDRVDADRSVAPVLPTVLTPIERERERERRERARREHERRAAAAAARPAPAADPGPETALDRPRIDIRA